MHHLCDNSIQPCLAHRKSLKAILLTCNPLKLFLETPFCFTDLSSKVYLFRRAFCNCQTQNSLSHADLYPSLWSSLPFFPLNYPAHSSVDSLSCLFLHDGETFPGLFTAVYPAPGIAQRGWSTNSSSK